LIGNMKVRPAARFLYRDLLTDPGNDHSRPILNAWAMHVNLIRLTARPMLPIRGPSKGLPDTAVVARNR
jgi:hypothetical protein